MVLFKRSHEQDPARKSGSTALKTTTSRFQRLLGKRGSNTRLDAGSVASSASGCSHTQEEERREENLIPTVQKNDLLVDHEKPQPAQSLWDQAYDALRGDNPQLVEKYETLLSRESQRTSACHSQARCRKS